MPELPENQRVVMDELLGTHSSFYEMYVVRVNYGAYDLYTGRRILNPFIPLEKQYKD
jgi:hypothetical protein